MSFETWRDDINSCLLEVLNESLPKHEFNEVIRYSVLPAGKLFRPQLVYSLSKDLGEILNDHKYFAVSLELHHTYTLIHDDLPAMDDDNMRRGRESSHIKFNEWKAILAGDGLLNMSYGILSKIKSNKLGELLGIYSELMGPKGLILGQIKDLGQENKTLEDLLEIHELKTARLIQLAFVGTNLLSTHPLPPSTCTKLGLALGVNFQILDDLCELTEEINSHESEINPFLHFKQSEIFNILNANTDLIKTTISDNKLNHLKDYINLYIEKICSILNNGREKLKENVEEGYLEVIEDLKL